MSETESSEFQGTLREKRNQPLKAYNVILKIKAMDILFHQEQQINKFFMNFQPINFTFIMYYLPDYFGSLLEYSAFERIAQD